MLRISDIFKKYREEKNKANPNSQDSGKEKPESKTEPVLNKPGPSDNNPNPSNKKISISAALNKELNRISSTDTEELYGSGLSCARRLYKIDAKYEEGVILEITAFLEKTIDLLKAGNRDLVRYCLSDYANFDDYLYCHIINVCIISLEMGLGLGFERTRLAELGLASFLHDLGIVRFMDIINKKDALTKEEFDKVKQHPNLGAEILNKFSKEISHNIFDVLKQEHERADGSGYPQGLKGDQINEYARIIGLADIYEAMIHKRPYRMRHNALETIKTILSGKAAFEARIIKVLIEKIGVFPLGTLCRLNTKEIAMVLKENPNLPLRPTVKILFDAYGKEITELRQINLADNSMIYIEESLNN